MLGYDRLLTVQNNGELQVRSDICIVFRPAAGASDKQELDNESSILGSCCAESFTTRDITHLSSSTFPATVLHPSLVILHLWPSAMWHKHSCKKKKGIFCSECHHFLVAYLTPRPLANLRLRPRGPIAHPSVPAFPLTIISGQPT